MARRAAQLRRSERLREIRNSIQETGSLLRSRGVIRTNGPMPDQSPGGLSDSPQHYPELEYFPSDPGNTSQSGPASPYFLPEDNGVYSNSHTPHDTSFNIMGRLTSSPSFNNESYPSSPELVGHPELHFLPIGDRLFYDSPESGSEPRTPGAFSDMHTDMNYMDPSPFFGNPDEMTF